MNLSQDTSLLKQINETLTSQEIDIDIIKLDIDNLNSIVTDIGVSMATEKFYFQRTLDYAGNNSLARLDYTSSPIVGTVVNDTDNKMYITEFTFTYPSDPANEPTSTQLYHSTSFTTKIGRYVGGGVSGFRNPYFEMTSNAEQLGFANARNNNFSDSPIYYRHAYTNAPILIPIGVSFGHLIQGDFSDTTKYLGDATATVKGYYYQ